MYSKARFWTPLVFLCMTVMATPAAAIVTLTGDSISGCVGGITPCNIDNGFDNDVAVVGGNIEFRGESTFSTFSGPLEIEFTADFDDLILQLRIDNVSDNLLSGGLVGGHFWQFTGFNFSTPSKIVGVSLIDTNFSSGAVAELVLDDFISIFTRPEDLAFPPDSRFATFGLELSPLATAPAPAAWLLAITGFVFVFGARKQH